MTTDEAAVEAMARAIYFAGERDWLCDPDPVPWEDANSAGKDFARLIAGAAFAALLVLDPLPAALVRAVLEREIRHCQTKAERWSRTLPLQSFRMTEHGAHLQARLAELAREESDGN